MEIRALKTSLFVAGQDLSLFITAHLPSLQDGDILVVTSKIVALAEHRLIAKGAEISKEEIIRQESSFTLETSQVYLTIKDGAVMANAGIDESNAGDNFILLPKDSFQAAAAIREYCLKHYQLRNLGVILSDSRCLPLRAGVTGIALGYAGFRGLKSYRGQEDLFGRPFRFSRVDVADSLATAAVLCMGEGAEQTPLAVISQAPVEYCDEVNPQELSIDINEDMYGPLFKALL